jgi:hypothetical protein
LIGRTAGLLLGIALAGPALAQDDDGCPSVEPLLMDAEKDTVSFYLAGAQTALVEAERRFGCQSVTPRTLARYWQAQAMIWYLQDRTIDSDRALIAGKRADPDFFNTDFGEELQARWEQTDIPMLAVDEKPVEIKLRGDRRGDRLRVDTRLVEDREVDPGLHLVQLERDGAVVYGKVVDATSGTTVELSVRDDAFGAPTVPLPPTGGTPQVPGLTGLSAPLSLKSTGVADAEGGRVPFHTTVVPLSMVAPGGVDLYAQRRRNARLQGVAVGLTGVGAWASYLFLWDLGVGDNLDDGVARLGLLNGVAMVSTGVVWESILLAKRRSNRKRTVAVANQALGVSPDASADSTP